MLEELKEKVCAANRELPRLGLVSSTWGASADNAAHNAAVLEETASASTAPVRITVRQSEVRRNDETIPVGRV